MMEPSGASNPVRGESSNMEESSYMGGSSSGSGWTCFDLDVLASGRRNMPTPAVPPELEEISTLRLALFIQASARP